MPADAVIHQHQSANGWSDLDVLEYLTEYVDNQRADDALDDFLPRKANEETDEAAS